MRVVGLSVLLVASVMVFSACEWLDPNLKKANSELRQEKIMKEDTELLRQQAQQLERIAKALEELVEVQKRNLR